MTNLELQQQFQNELREDKTIFDIYLSLEKIKPLYKTTPFYMATKKTIQESFVFYMQTLGSIDYLIGLFKNLDENSESTNNIVNKITEGLSMDGILNMMDDNNKELFKELLPFVQR